MKIFAISMGRNYRFLLKWLIIVIFLTAIFNFVLGSLVESILSGSISSLNRFGLEDSMSNYDESLVSWARTGSKSKLDSSTLKYSTRNDLKLIGAQIVFRHGARTPLHLLPNLEEAVYEKEQIDHYPPSVWEIKVIRKVGNRIASNNEVFSAQELNFDLISKLKSVEGVEVFTGQLTSLGEKQLFELGRKTRQNLIDFDEKNLLPEFYDPKFIYCRSTFMNRTVRSARAFLAGLFYSNENLKKIQAKIPFEIEVHNFTQEDLFPNPKITPELKNCLNCSTLYASLNDQHEMKRARDAFLKRIQYLEYHEGITELHDDVVSRQAHGFPVPEDLAELAKEFHVMSAREFTIRATSIGFEKFVRLTCGRLLTLIISNFKFMAENYLKTINEKESDFKIYRKFFVYSGHDSTLIPLAMALEIFDMVWPPYASHILLKLFVSRNNPEEKFVLVAYNDQPQLLPNCSDYFCPLETFMTNLKNRYFKTKLDDEF